MTQLTGTRDDPSGKASFWSTIPHGNGPRSSHRQGIRWWRGRGSDPGSCHSTGTPGPQSTLPEGSCAGGCPQNLGASSSVSPCPARPPHSDLSALHVHIQSAESGLSGRGSQLHSPLFPAQGHHPGAALSAGWEVGQEDRVGRGE